MNVQILATRTNKKVLAKIEKAELSDMPAKRNGWQFTWKFLFKTEGSTIYKLTSEKSPATNEGLLMLSLMNEEMLYMNNIEVAPHNLGKTAEYDYIAACLIAFACWKSFETGQHSYKGYLTFESKSELIPLYEKKYGAILAKGRRMFIPPKTGLKLINKYLKNESDV